MERIRGQYEPVGSRLGFSVDRSVILAFLPLCILTLMVALEAASLSVALPVVSENLGGTAVQAFWSGTSFVLCSACFQLVFTSLSNAFGRQLLIICATILFLVGTIVCGVSVNFKSMLVGRSIQGTGGGGIIVLSEISVSDMVPLQYRGLYWGVLGSMWSIGSVVGPVLGGGFCTNVSWRWIFYINIPFAVLSTPLIFRYLKITTETMTRSEKVKRFDIVGLAGFVCSIGSFLVGLSWGGVMYQWTSWHTLVPLVLGFFGIIGVLVYETYVPIDPILRLSGVENRSLLVSYVGATLHGLTLWCLLYYLPLYSEAVHGFTPLMAGVAALPLALAIAPSACIAGAIAVFCGRYRTVIWIAWSVATLGFGILCYLDITTKVAVWVCLIAIPGLGLGALVTSVAYAIQTCADNQSIVIVTALFSFFRAFGQALGMSIGGVIFQNRMQSNLLKHPAFAGVAGEISRNAEVMVRKMNTMQLDQSKIELRQVYAESLRDIWVFCCVCTAVAGLLSLLTKEYCLDQSRDTDQRLRGRGERHTHSANDFSARVRNISSLYS
ncbi:hypothetical protein N7462_009709 [Penicillium macrosclerotiorum]|uniref:uncharacterized protein n=1 Tax=Penicillium macrosclerotiorum TaxID=303699 RepID=UPI002546D662|nr:uncharacterized protein N7462_009709 [Penicillium macrosclerotiorum]KAJ5674270.1 hypothetical protein N7462_009709 [Penicillium macrosclerotiorum]